MKKLTQIIAYILDNYPYKDELSNARVTKMIYLADWRSAITNKSQISDISWYFDNHGPFVWDVYNEVDDNKSIFHVSTETNLFGGTKRRFSLINKPQYNLLLGKELGVIDKIIESTKSLNWNQFIQLVYSTYPIVSSERYSKLNLLEKANEFNNQKAEA